VTLGADPVGELRKLISLQLVAPQRNAEFFGMVKSLFGALASTPVECLLVILDADHFGGNVFNQFPPPRARFKSQISELLLFLV